MNWVCAACGGTNPGGTRFCGHCGVRAAEETAGERTADERRLVTALFADISGFTPLADSLDEDALHEIISPLVTRMAAIGGRFDGHVAKYAGDALLMFFGAPIAHEDHAERALLVAIELHKELAQALPDVGMAAGQLQLHVGVNTGRVVSGLFPGEGAGDYSILGDAVILAQRLESVAPAGETYVGETTYQLTSDSFELDFVGELTLKGKPRPVPAWRLLGERQAVRYGRRGGGSDLIGRERELCAGADLIEGAGGIVSITGDPGVGKSRLTEEIRRRVEASGTRWLDARCLSYGAGLPYWPYADLLRRTFGITAELLGEAAVDRLAAGVGYDGDAVTCFGSLLGLPVSSDMTELEPEAFRRALHAAFERWFKPMAGDSLVLAIEDLHWADSSSTALTAELARLCNDSGLHLVLTGRPEARQTIDAIGRSLAPERKREIELAPLDEDGTRELVEGILEGEAPPEALRAVNERTAGNPFFAQETVRALIDEGALLRDRHGWHMRAGWDPSVVPATVEGVLAARIDLLPKPATNVLQMASVVGRQVRMPLLRSLATDVADLDGELERLVQAGFLDPVPGVDTLLFHHALVLDVAYSRLLRRQRRELHLRLADTAERLYGAGDDVIDLLARHMYLGEAGTKAIRYLVRAGERAQRLFANEEAIVHLGRAAEVARKNGSRGGQLAEILLTLAGVHELRGHYDDALALYTEVRDETGDVRSWCGMASTIRRRESGAAALELVDDAFADGAFKGRDAGALWLERAWALVVEGRYEEAIESALSGLRDAAGATAGHLLLQMMRAELFTGSLESALEHGLEAQRVFETEDDLRGLVAATRAVGGAYTDLGRFDEAALTLRRSLELADRIGSVEEIAASLVNLGLAEQERGQLDEAIACDRRAIAELERIGHTTGQAITYVNLAEKLARRGDLADATRCCLRGRELAESGGMRMTVAEADDTAASIFLRMGRADDAAATAEEAAALFLEMGAVSRAADSLDRAADAWSRLEMTERARDAEQRARALR